MITVIKEASKSANGKLDFLLFNFRPIDTVIRGSLPYQTKRPTSPCKNANKC